MLLGRVVFLILLLYPLLSESGPVAEREINSHPVDQPIPLEIFLLQDPENRLGIADVSDPSMQDQFVPLAAGDRNQGFTKTAYWVRFILPPSASDPPTRYLELNYPSLDRIELFTPLPQGGFQQRVAGDAEPFALRELVYRNPLFVLQNEPGAGQTYYVRLQTTGSMQINLRAWIPEAFVEHASSTLFGFGLYYGVMLILALAAAIALFYLKDLLFLYYSSYLVSYLLLQLMLNGFAFQYLWPNQIWMANRGLILLMALSLIFGMLFAGRFLRVLEHDNWLRNLFRVMLILIPLGLLLSMLVDYSLAIQFMAGTAMVVVLIGLLASVFVFLKGYKPAGIFLIAYGLFLLGVMISSLVYLGFIRYHFLTINAIQIGSMLEVIVLMLALVVRRTSALEEANIKLRDQAVRDSLTGLLNHGEILDRLDEMLNTAKRYQEPLSIIMLDLDHFKQINDRYGHLIGDKVLIAVADVMQKTIRSADLCGRYGGEEFMLVLGHTNREQAIELAERLREEVMNITIHDATNVMVTASFGIAVLAPESTMDLSVEELIRHADSALYTAKRGGRNRVNIV